MIKEILTGLSVLAAGGLISQWVILMAQDMKAAPAKCIPKAEVMK